MNDSKFTLIDWIILGIATASIVANLLLLIFTPGIMNVLSTFLFQLLTLILGVYIAFRITTISIMNKTIELQKNTAKTAIRHIRGYQWSVEALIEIVKKKISGPTDNKLKDTLTEINHHLANLSMGIGLSENDFKDILGEEFQEERILITKLNNDIDLLNKKVNEVKKLNKKKEQTDKERINALEKEIQELRNGISSDIYRLPISGAVHLPEREYYSPFGIKVQDIVTPFSHIGPALSEKLKPLTHVSFKLGELTDLLQEENQNKNTEKTIKTKKRKIQKK